MQLTFSALALLGLLGLLGLVTARPQHDVHPTLAVDLLQSRSPKAWLQGGLKASKCHDRKVVDSNSILAKGVSFLENEGFVLEPEDISMISPLSPGIIRLQEWGCIHGRIAAGKQKIVAIWRLDPVVPR